MNYADAARYIEHVFSDRIFDGNHQAHEARKKALEALNKRITGNVIFKDDGDVLLCPDCGFDLMGCVAEPEHDPRCCPECGKALSWHQTVTFSHDADYLNDLDERFVELPCKIGDRVWGLRNCKGVMHPQEGIVSEMRFLPDMRLQIVIKNVCRGEYGKAVFGTYNAAMQAIERGQK